MRLEDQNAFYPKMPCYMMYPAGNVYLTEMEYEKDLDRMQSYFPAETKKVMEIVEQRLDELDYEGSRIYDEEPDRLMMQEELEELYQQVKSKMEPEAEQPEGMRAQQSYFAMVPMAISGERPHGHPEKSCSDSWLCSMVGVLFGTGIYRRRCHHRRCRRWYREG